jgi:ribosomal large subunit pseudouridine synthase B (EC 5.4.99.-)
VITEGRNREVRRLWETQGVTVSRLKRVRYGDIYLEKDLPRGGWREMELKEVNYLREMVEMKPESQTVITPEDQKRKKSRQKIRRAVRRYEERIDSHDKPKKARQARRGNAPAAGPKGSGPKKGSPRPGAPRGKGKPRTRK